MEKIIGAKVIDQLEGDVPLLRVYNGRQFNGLFREVDQTKVNRVISYLTQNGMESYLGGSVITNALFQGKPRTYRDIDLLAVGKKRETRKVLGDLRNLLSGVGENPFNFETEIQVDGETVPYEVVMDVKNASKNMYEFMAKDKKGKFRPVAAQRFELKVVEPKRSKAATIDLAVVEKAVFDKGFGFVLQQVGY